MAEMRRVGDLLPSVPASGAEGRVERPADVRPGADAPADPLGDELEAAFLKVCADIRQEVRTLPVDISDVQLDAKIATHLVAYTRAIIRFQRSLRRG